MLLINNFDFKKSFQNGFEFIRIQNNFNKFFIIFWFLGPLIFLIERSPADLWLTIIGLAFLGRSFYHNDWSWFKIPWFKYAFLFWIVSLISSLFSYMPIFTFSQGFFWLRFPLFAVATQVWLGGNRDIRVLMLIIIIIFMMIMSIILFSEILLEPKPRLSWPYGDLIPGSYLAKFCLPASCVLVSIAFVRFSKLSFISGLLFLTTMLASALTGERTNFLIRIFSSFFSIILVKFKFKNVLFWFSIIFIIISSIFIYNKYTWKEHRIFERYSIDYFAGQAPLLNFNGSYWGTWRSGIQQAIENPIIGVGPSGTRHTCGYLENNSWLPGKNYCGNHPHNMHIQVFAETGIIGYILFVLMFYNIIKICYKGKVSNRDCLMASTSIIIPLAFFFPIQQTGSFFGQWSNLFMWFSIGFSLSHSNTKT